MRIRNRHLEALADDVDALAERDDIRNNQYARGGSTRSPRRRATKSTGSRSASSSVPLGIAARRKRRWSW
jgi:hypothetical protein